MEPNAFNHVYTSNQIGLIARNRNELAIMLELELYSFTLICFAKLFNFS